MVRDARTYFNDLKQKSYLSRVQTWYVSMWSKTLSCWLWVHVGGDFPSRLVSFVVSVWPRRKKAQQNSIAAIKTQVCAESASVFWASCAQLQPKSSAQVVEFVWIDGEAERVVAKTLALFVSLQFIQIKRPTSGTVWMEPRLRVSPPLFWFSGGVWVAASSVLVFVIF